MCRRATIQDSDRILQIRNHPSNLVYFNNHKPIPAQQHSVWFDKMYINSSINYCFVFEVDNTVQAYCRFDLDATNVYTCAIAVDLNYQGIGIGSTLLQKSLSFMPVDVKITAEVHKDNPRSVSLFKTCGFALFKTSNESYYFKLQTTCEQGVK